MREPRREDPAENFGPYLIYEALGRTQDAIADYRRVLAADPSMKGAIDGLRRLGVSPSDRAASPR